MNVLKHTAKFLSISVKAGLAQGTLTAQAAQAAQLNNKPNPPLKKGAE